MRLLERTTRRARLTDAGTRLAERVRFAQSVIVQAEQEATTGASELRGNLRLALPATLGRLWFAPFIPDFLRRYPALQLDIDYSERYTDLVGEGVDVAIRVGKLSHSRTSCQAAGRTSTSSGSAFANMACRNRHRTSQPTIALSSRAWRVIRINGRRTQVVHAHGSLRSNDSTALLEAARAGIGILCAGEWLVTRTSPLESSCACCRNGRSVPMEESISCVHLGSVHILTCGPKAQASAAKAR